MTVSISVLDALIEDEMALDSLLEPLPEPESMRPGLSPGGVFFGHVWHREASCDYWISSDGKRVVRFTIEGLSLQKAWELRSFWDSVRHENPDIALDAANLADMIEGVTGQRAVLDVPSEATIQRVS
jgi:hypothetical protein